MRFSARCGIRQNTSTEVYRKVLDRQSLFRLNPNLLAFKKLRTLSPPTYSAVCEPGEATTCKLSVAYGLGRNQTVLRSVLGVHVVDFSFS